MPEPWKPLTGLDELTEAQSAPAQQPQFSRAEYTQNTGIPSCKICGTAISHEYFQVNTQLVCPGCAEKVRGGQVADGHAAFAQAVLYGTGAAVVGLMVYAGFTIATHFYIGYVALAVGWMVGKAMMKGSNGVGGRRYQIAAVLLTYAAISLASVPIMIAEVAPAREVDWVSRIPELILYGIASPFLDVFTGVFGIIGLVILGVGMRYAWRITAARQLVVTGPHYLTGARV
jgi:hypothetical protein